MSVPGLAFGNYPGLSVFARPKSSLRVALRSLLYGSKGIPVWPDSPRNFILVEGREQRDSSLRRSIGLLGILLFSFRTPAMPIHCLSCHSKHIHRSKTRGTLEHLLGLLALRPYRCEECDYRFFYYSRLSAGRHKPASERHSAHLERHAAS